MTDATATPATTVPNFSWERSTEQRYHEMLNVLPPREWKGRSFLVGEAYDHEGPRYTARYRMFRQEGELFLMSSRPVAVSEFEVLRSAPVVEDDIIESGE